MLVPFKSFTFLNLFCFIFLNQLFSYSKSVIFLNLYLYREMEMSDYAYYFIKLNFFLCWMKFYDGKILRSSYYLCGGISYCENSNIWLIYNGFLSPNLNYSSKFLNDSSERLPMDTPVNSGDFLLISESPSVSFLWNF